MRQLAGPCIRLGNPRVEKHRLAKPWRQRGHIAGQNRSITLPFIRIHRRRGMARNRQCHQTDHGQPRKGQVPHRSNRCTNPVPVARAFPHAYIRGNSGGGPGVFPGVFPGLFPGGSGLKYCNGTGLNARVPRDPYPKSPNTKDKEKTSKDARQARRSRSKAFCHLRKLAKITGQVTPARISRAYLIFRKDGKWKRRVSSSECRVCVRVITLSLIA